MRRRSYTLMFSRGGSHNGSLAIVAAAFMAVASLALSSGCGGNSPPPVRLDDAVEITEDTLTDVLLGASPGESVSQAPLDKPLLRRGVYETVWLAADEKGFEKLSRGALRESSIRNIEDRVVRTIGKRIERRGAYTAKSVAFPVPSDLTASADKTLLATIVPIIQEAGSPEDRARGKNRRLVLVRLTVADARTGEALAVRDYYSGSEVVVKNDRDRSAKDSGKDSNDDLENARNRATAPWRREP